MRFMMFMTLTANVPAEDYGPQPEDVTTMQRYNEELQKAGVLLSLDGLHHPDAGARVDFTGGTPKVLDGPFTEAKEVIGGYWLIDVSSKEEAVEWATRCPGEDGCLVEIRRVYEMSDFSPDIQAAAELPERPPEQTASQHPA
jgi:hypothetical protein